MKAAIAHIASDRRLRSLAIGLLAIDLALIALFVLWATTRRFELTHMWMYGQSQFSMAEGQLTEQWGYGKLALAALSVAMIARARRQLFFWALSALLLVMLASDSLQLHERINDVVHPPFRHVLDRMHTDLLIKSTLGALPLLAMALGFRAARAQDRRPMFIMAIPVLLLGFWTSFVDFAHNIFEIGATSGRTIGDIIEEGGEGVLISLVLIVAIAQLAAQHPLED